MIGYRGFPIVLLMFAFVGCTGEGPVAPRAIAPAEQPDPSPWCRWQLRDTPIFEGALKLAADPCVIRVGNEYWMYYTAPDFADQEPRATICLAKSPDGLKWAPAQTPVPKVAAGAKPPHVPGCVFVGRKGKWDEDIETAFVLQIGQEFILYYTGYEHAKRPYPMTLGIARSRDGVHFERVSDGPAMTRSKGWYDNDGIVCPTVIPYKGGYVMIYTGHAVYDFSKVGHPGIFLMGATSKDGIHWTKHDQPVLSPNPEITWMKDGVAESSLMAGPDGKYYLFFTALQDEERTFAVAQGDSPFGPWDVSPCPILIPPASDKGKAQFLAPEVHVEGSRVRMWFHENIHMGDEQEFFRICYAEAPWPLKKEGATKPGAVRRRHAEKNERK